MPTCMDFMLSPRWEQVIYNWWSQNMTYDHGHCHNGFCHTCLVTLCNCDKHL